MNKIYVIFTANEEFDGWRYIDNFRGRFTYSFSEEVIEDLTKYFQEKILNYEVDILGTGRTISLIPVMKLSNNMDDFKEKFEIVFVDKIKLIRQMQDQYQLTLEGIE